nr:ribonuclease H-like domain-containing protein [Tanacetum cinerariifolium]
DKLVYVTPKNKDKRVKLTEPITSSGNTSIKTASSSNLVSNKPTLSSTRVKLFTSVSGSQPSEQCVALITQVNQKSVEISYLNANLQEKGLIIVALNDELKKLKGKAFVNNAITTHTIALETLKINVEPLAHGLLNNRTTHSDYLRLTQEQAAILKEVVEQGKSQNLLNNSLDSSCKYTKQIQELLIIIRQTCPSINNSSDKLVYVTPKNKDKRVKLTEPIKSSGNTITKTASSLNLVSNKPMLSSTRVKLFTSVSGSQPSGNTKKDKIQQPPSSTRKNKVEAYPKTVKSSLKNKNCVIKHKGNDSGCSKHMTEDRSQLTNFVNKFLGTIKFSNDHVEKITGYGDHRIGNVTISRVYYVEGLGHNLFSFRKFCDWNLEVAFHQHTYFIRNLEGVDLLTGSRGNNLPKENTKCVSAAGEELTAAKHKLKLLVYCCRSINVARRKLLLLEELPTRLVEGVAQPVAPTTIEQKLARKNELKARGHFARECRSPKDTRRPTVAEPQRRSVPVETSTSNVLVSQCDATGSYDWSYQAKEEPTKFALMAFSSSSSNSSSDCEALSLLKQDCLESVEARLLVYKKNESVLEENIKLLNIEVQLRDTALATLRQKLETTEKDRDDLNIKLEKFQTSSKRLTDLLASQTSDKAGLGYNSKVFVPSRGYHAVPPPMTGTFMPPKPDLVFHTPPLDENKHIAFNVQLSPTKHEQDLPSTSSAPIIKDWVSDSEEEDIPQDCDFHAKKLAQNSYASRDIHKHHAQMNHSRIPLHTVFATAPFKSKPVLLAAARKIGAARPTFSKTRPHIAPYDVSKSKATLRRPFIRHTSPKPSISPPKVNAANLSAVSTAWVNAARLSAVSAARINAVKPYAVTAVQHNHTKKKGKQHRASCMTKSVSSVDQPLFRLHIDLFGPTFVKSLSKKSYCLVVTDDYSRFSWVFFLASKDDTTSVLKTFIVGLENLPSLKVKIIKCDNGTEFKNADLNQFYGLKGSGPAWLFDIDSLSHTMNYHPVLAENQSNPTAGFQDTEKAKEEETQTYVFFPVLSDGSTNPKNNKDAHTGGNEHNDDIQKSVSPDKHSSSCGDQVKEQGDKAINKDKVSAAELNFKNSTNDFSAAGPLNAAMPNLEDLSQNVDDVGAEADTNNMESIISVSPIPTHRIHKDHQLLKLLVICLQLLRLGVWQEELEIKVEYHRCSMKTFIPACLPVSCLKRSPKESIKLSRIQVG